MTKTITNEIASVETMAIQNKENRLENFFIDNDYIDETIKYSVDDVTNIQTNTKTNGKSLSMVDPTLIYIDDSNIRFTLGSKEKMLELEQSILTYGIQQPILLYLLSKDDKGYNLGYKYGITHGFRRTQATKNINEYVDKDKKIQRIPALFSEKLNEVDSILSHLTLNNGVSLNALELGKAYLRLKELKGFTISQLAKLLVKADSDVFNKIKLYEQSLQSEVIKEVLQEDLISSTEIIKLNTEFNNDSEIIDFVVKESVKKAQTRKDDKKPTKTKDITKNTPNNTIEKKIKATNKDIQEVKKENKDILSKNDNKTQMIINDFISDISDFINQNLDPICQAKNISFDKLYNRLIDTIEKTINK